MDESFDKNFLERFKTCIQNGIELDTKGHALIQLTRRGIDVDRIFTGLQSFDTIEDIEVYSPPNQYRVFIRLSGKKSLVIGIILTDICVVKTVFIRDRKIQSKVEKRWSHLK